MMRTVCKMLGQMVLAIVGGAALGGITVLIFKTL